jgi:hypothetical protein
MVMQVLDSATACDVSELVPPTFMASIWRVDESAIVTVVFVPDLQAMEMEYIEECVIVEHV